MRPTNTINVVLSIAMFIIPGSAFGGLNRWSLSEVTFSDGGTAEGFFDLDGGVVENWRITVAGGNEALFPEFTYSPANSTVSRVLVAAWAPEPTFFFRDSASVRELRITPAAPLADEGGTVDLDLETGGGGSGGVECFNCGPARTITGGSLVAGSAEETLLFPQFGNGGGLISELVLANTTALEASLRVEFRDGEGVPMDVGISEAPLGAGAPTGIFSSIDFALPPFGTVTIPTDGLGNEPSAGSVVVLSDRRVGGVVRFSIAGVGIAGVGASPPLTEFIVPVRRKAGVINTGLALRNAVSTPVRIEMTLARQDGTVAPHGSETIDDFAGSGQLARFIDELFPDADTDDFKGSVRVEIFGGSVAATALELGGEPGQFTTLPVINLLGP
jgi:hypothetical protein